MLYNIRLISQRQQVSALLLKQNSSLCCTPGCLFINGSLSIFNIIVAAVFVYIFTKCSGFADRDGLEGPLNG